MFLILLIIIHEAKTVAPKKKIVISLMLTKSSFIKQSTIKNV